MTTRHRHNRPRFANLAAALIVSAAALTGASAAATSDTTSGEAEGVGGGRCLCPCAEAAPRTAQDDGDAEPYWARPGSATPSPEPEPTPEAPQATPAPQVTPAPAPAIDLVPAEPDSPAERLDASLADARALATEVECSEREIAARIDRLREDRARAEHGLTELRELRATQDHALSGRLDLVRDAEGRIDRDLARRIADGFSDWYAEADDREPRLVAFLDASARELEALEGQRRTTRGICDLPLPALPDLPVGASPSVADALAPLTPERAAAADLVLERVGVTP
jgi:hypothetical protein